MARRGRPPLHGRSNDPTWQSWRAMRKRCRQKTHVAYDRYQHFEICARWESFNNFLIDMGERPEGKTLDRIDNNKGYYPENCRWATLKEQIRNSNLTRLNPVAVQVIRHMKKHKLTTGRAIARAYGISEQSVCDITAGRSWV